MPATLLFFIIVWAIESILAGKLAEWGRILLILCIIWDVARAHYRLTKD